MEIFVKQTITHGKLTQTFCQLSLILGAHTSKEERCKTKKTNMKYHNWSILWKYSAPGSTRYYKQIQRKSKKTALRSTNNLLNATVTWMIGSFMTLLRSFVQIIFKTMNNFVWIIFKYVNLFVVGFLLCMVYVMVFVIMKKVLPNIRITWIPYSVISDYPTTKGISSLFMVNEWHILHDVIQSYINGLETHTTKLIGFIFSNSSETITLITKRTITKCRQVLWYSFDFMFILAVLCLLYTVSVVRLFQRNKSTKSTMKWAVPFTDLHYSPLITIPPLLTKKQGQYVRDVSLTFLITCIAMVVLYISSLGDSGYDTQNRTVLSVLHYLCKGVRKGISPLFVKSQTQNSIISKMSIEEFTKAKQEKRRQSYQNAKKKRKKTRLVIWILFYVM